MVVRLQWTGPAYKTINQVSHSPNLRRLRIILCRTRSSWLVVARKAVPASSSAFAAAAACWSNTDVLLVFRGSLPELLLQVAPNDDERVLLGLVEGFRRRHPLVCRCHHCSRSEHDPTPTLASLPPRSQQQPGSLLVEQLVSQHNTDAIYSGTVHVAAILADSRIKILALHDPCSSVCSSFYKRIEIRSRSIDPS